MCFGAIKEKKIQERDMTPNLVIAAPNTTIFYTVPAVPVSITYNCSVYPRDTSADGDLLSWIARCIPKVIDYIVIVTSIYNWSVQL